MSRYIDEHRGRFGVEPICRTLDASASAYHQRATGERSERQVADEQLLSQIKTTHAANYCAYGYRKMWLALKRAGHDDVGRDRVKRLMRTNAIQGAKHRGKPWRTTTPDPAATRPPDLVDRDFSATRPDELWLADFTYLRCWEGVVFFSFVIDAFSRRIVGWQFASNMRTDLVLDALRMALTRRQAGADIELVHHSDAGSQPELNRSSQQCVREINLGPEARRAARAWAETQTSTPGSPPRTLARSPASRRPARRGRGPRESTAAVALPACQASV